MAADRDGKLSITGELNAGNPVTEDLIPVSRNSLTDF
jgi:hypothetical protein